jgi:cobaltochelatase CobS
MENNEIIQQVIDTIRTDILTNKQFLKSILSDIQLTEQNIDPNLILKLMAELNAQQQPPRPVSNAPKSKGEKGKAVARPIAIGEDSIEAKIVSDLLEGNNVYLMGKAGTGKTYVAKAIAKDVMRQQVYIINCSQWTSPIEIRGGQTIKGYEEGQLIKAWANGGILILDELPKLDPNTAGLLNDALAEAAAQPKYDEAGKVIEDTIPTITNGKGQTIKKGQDQEDDNLKYRFCVIATGNTDMMNVGSKYGGNQRQDYSLVDRFAGSFYTIEADPTKEKQLTYPYVFEVANAMRDFLNKVDAAQSISLRTMLNFSRTYEQEMLYKIEVPDGKDGTQPSPFADDIYSNDGRQIAPKSVDDSISSFLSLLEPNMRKQLEDDPEFRQRKSSKPNLDTFIRQFESKYGLNPKTGKAI